MTDRALLLEHLDQSKSHLEIGASNIAKQQKLIATLERDGENAVEAHRTLATFERIQAQAVVDHEHVERELAQTEY